VYKCKQRRSEYNCRDISAKLFFDGVPARPGQFQLKFKFSVQISKYRISTGEITTIGIF